MKVRRVTGALLHCGQGGCDAFHPKGGSVAEGKCCDCAQQSCNPVPRAA
jgi:hypothetical protein